MTTTRYAAWMRAFAAERRAAVELGEAYMAAHDDNLTERTRRTLRRALGKANSAHCRAIRRERAARARLSRADLDRARQFALELVAAA